MLLAFMEQLKYRYKSLIENAIVESEKKNIFELDLSALLLASVEIRHSYRKYSGEEDEESDED